MNKFMIAATLVIGMAGFTAIAHADQGIPNLPAQPLVAQQMVSAAGEQYPTFSDDTTPVVSERVVANNGGQNYPTFANPTNGGATADYAAIGTATTQTTQLAAMAGFNHFGG